MRCVRVRVCVVVVKTHLAHLFSEVYVLNDFFEQMCINDGVSERIEKQNKTKTNKTEEIEIFLWYFLGFFLCIRFGRLWQADRHVNTISHTLVLASLRSLVYIRGFSHSFMRYFTAYTCILYLSTILCGIKCIVMFDGFLLIYLFITIQKKTPNPCTTMRVCIVVACAHFYWLFCGLFLFFLSLFFFSFLYRIVLIASHCGFSVIFLHT